MSVRDRLAFWYPTKRGVNGGYRTASTQAEGGAHLDRHRHHPVPRAVAPVRSTDVSGRNGAHSRCVGRDEGASTRSPPPPSAQRPAPCLPHPASRRSLSLLLARHGASTPKRAQQAHTGLQRSIPSFQNSAGFSLQLRRSSAELDSPGQSIIHVSAEHRTAR